ncbi:MAG: TolC family outer membrane protein [Gammaproteobacteria bacterium]|nr:TolC family outer membrane protein [Gammaproteobacteria bacterium]
MKLKSLSISIPLLLWLSTAVSATTLQQAVDITVKTNPDILAASNERNAVAEEVNQARAGYLPTIDLAVGTGWESSDNPTSRNSTTPSNHKNIHMNRDEASIQLRQMIFDGMATQSEVKRQQARTQSRAYGVFGASENTALEATKAYIDVLRVQKLVDLAATNFEAHERTHDQIKLRSDRGVGRKADLDQSQGRLALARANLIAEQSNLRDAETNYLRVVGVVPESLSDPESPSSLIPETLDEAIGQALGNHPTLKSAEADVQSAHAQYDTAQSPFYPRIDLELGATANNDLDGVDGHNNDVTAMIRLRYNLLNGGKDSARSEETAHLINQAAEIRNNTHRQVEQSIRLSWNALQTVNNQISYFEQHVDSSEKSRNAYQQQFSLGQRTLLDLLDSENEVFTARQNLVNARYDQLFAMYRILNSMGALLQGLEVGLPDAAKVVSN